MSEIEPTNDAADSLKDYRRLYQMEYERRIEAESELTREVTRRAEAIEQGITLNKVINNLRARLDAAEAKVSILQTANDNIAAALHDVEDQRDAAEAERDRLDAECEKLADQCDDLEIKLEDLQAVVDKLPKTADGVPVVPGMKVWRNAPLGVGEHDTLYYDDYNGMCVVLDCRDSLLLEGVSAMYSTREAAEAASNHSVTEAE